MATTVTSQIQGITINEAIKAPVHAVSTTNLTLSGLQTVGGVVLNGTTLKRVLAKDQINPVENGIYDASSGGWTRSKDFDGTRDVVQGTLVINQNNTDILYRVTTANPVIIGTSNIVFELSTIDFTQSEFSAFLALSDPYKRTAAEIAAGVTPTNYAKAPTVIIRQGADPSGVSDSRTAIMNQIDAAIEGDGYVDLGIGTFRVDSQITIDRSTFNRLRIHGHGWLTKLVHNSGQYLFKIDDSGGSDVNLLQLDNFAVDAAGNASANSAVYMSSAGRSIINRLYLTNYDKSSGTEIEKGYPIILADDSIGLVDIIDCNIGDGYGGIYTKANGVNIRGGIIEANAGPGVWIESGDGINVDGLRMQSIGTYGIHARVASGLGIRGSYFESCATYSIYLGSSSLVRGCGINAGNTFGGATGTHHIAVDQCHGVDITGNNFSTEGSVGLIKVAGAGSTIGFNIGVNGISDALVTAGTYTLLTETAPLAFGSVWNPKDFTVKFSGADLAVRTTLNRGVQHVGGNTNTTIPNDQAITLTISNAALISVTDNTTGKSGAFFVTYASATVIEIADPSAFWEVTNTDSGGNMAIYKSANSLVVTIRNYSNASINISVNVLGVVAAATAPA